MSNSEFQRLKCTRVELRASESSAIFSTGQTGVALAVSWSFQEPGPFRFCLEVVILWMHCRVIKRLRHWGGGSQSCWPILGLNHVHPAFDGMLETQIR